MPPITPAQIRGARGMAGWSKVELAKAAGVSVSAVLGAEGHDAGRVSAAAVVAIRGALEAAGVEFTGGDDGVGLRLKEPRRSTLPRLM